MNLFNHLSFHLLITLNWFQYLLYTEIRSSYLQYTSPSTLIPTTSTLFYFTWTILLLYTTILFLLVTSISLTLTGTLRLVPPYLQNPSVILCFRLSQVVHSPTHLKGNILDLVLTNSDKLISNVEVIPPYHSLSSDHYIISFQLSLLKSVFSRVKPRYVFDFPKANLSGLCDILLDIDFPHVLHQSTSNMSGLP